MYRIPPITWILLAVVVGGACVDLHRPLPRDGGRDLAVEAVPGDGGEALSDADDASGDGFDAAGDVAQDMAADAPADTPADAPADSPADLPPSTLTQGLVGYWRLDDNAGTLAADSSDLKNDGVIEGIPGLATIGLPKLSFADPGAFTFAANDDGVRVPSNLSLHPTSRISVAAWVRLATVDNHGLCGTLLDPKVHYLVFQRNARSDSSAALEGFALLKQADGTFAFVLATYNGVRHAAVSVQRAATGVWYHVVGTFDGQTVRIYVNGTAEASIVHAFPIEYDPSRPLYLGRTGECGGAGEAIYDAKLSGALDDVRIYDRVLSVREVSALASGAD